MIGTPRFEECLQDLESGSAPRRLAAARGLTRHGDERSRRVLTALLQDRDPAVRGEARLYLGNTFSDDKRVLFTNPLEILDEAFFMVTRSLGKLARLTFTWGLVKPVFCLLLLWSAYEDGPGASTKILLGAIAYQLLWRPILFERTVAALDSVGGKRIVPFRGERIKHLIVWNIVRFLCWLPAGGILLVATVREPDLVPPFLAAIASLLLTLGGMMLAIPLLPAAIRRVPADQLIRILSSGFKTPIIHRTAASFIILLCGLYTMFFVSSFATAAFLDLVHRRDFFVSLIGLLLAEVFLDPVWVAWCVLIDRLQTGTRGQR